MTDHADGVRCLRSTPVGEGPAMWESVFYAVTENPRTPMVIPAAQERAERTEETETLNTERRSYGDGTEASHLGESRRPAPQNSKSSVASLLRVLCLRFLRRLRSP